MTLIQNRSDPAIEQITKEDQLTVVSLIIRRLLREFAVEIGWKEEKISFKLTHRQRFPDDSCMFILTRDENLGDNEPDAPNDNL